MSYISPRPQRFTQHTRYSNTALSFTQEMAEVLGVISVVIQAAGLYSQLTYNVFEIVTLKGLRRSFLELKEDYGVIQATLLIFIFPDARHVLKRIKRQLLDPQSDGMTAMEEAMALKKSMTDDCSMLAVAVGWPPILAICPSDTLCQFLLRTNGNRRLLSWRK